MSNKYGIQFQPLSKKIDVGLLNRKNTQFLDHEDITFPAIKAVCEYVLAHYGDDGMYLGHGDEGFEIDVKRVSKRKSA